MLQAASSSICCWRQASVSALRRGARRCFSTPPSSESKPKKSFEEFPDWPKTGTKPRRRLWERPLQRDAITVEQRQLVAELNERRAAADTDGAWEALVAAGDRGLAPNPLILGAGAQAMAVGGRWRQAEQLLAEGLNSGLTKGELLLTYKGILAAYKEADEGEKALKLLREMQREGVRTDRTCYNVTTEALIGVDPMRALLLAQEMVDRRVPLNPDLVAKLQEI